MFRPYYPMALLTITFLAPSLPPFAFLLCLLSSVTFTSFKGLGIICFVPEEEAFDAVLVLLDGLCCWISSFAVVFFFLVFGLSFVFPAPLDLEEAIGCCCCCSFSAIPPSSAPIGIFAVGDVGDSQTTDNRRSPSGVSTMLNGRSFLKKLVLN